MAHGGAPDWNETVSRAVAPLKERVPTALALGMADSSTLQAALDSLQAAGVRRVAVVRLFMSGSSFLHETEFLLGLRSDPPPAVPHGSSAAPLRGHSGAATPLRHTLDIRLSRVGIGADEVTADILEERALEAAGDAHHRRVVLVAHGMGDERENEMVLSEMAAVGNRLGRRGFVAVQAALREDWPEVREQAEAYIRSLVASAANDVYPPLVVPFRLSGFGPYAKVLDGLTYVSTPGLLPHPRVTDWLITESARLLCPDGRVPELPCR